MELTHSLLLSVYGVRISIYMYIPIHHQLRITMRNAWTHRILLFDRIVAKNQSGKKLTVLSLTLRLVFAYFFFHMKREFYWLRPEKLSHVSHKKKRRRKKIHDRPTNKHTLNTNAYACTHILRIECCFVLSLV